MKRMALVLAALALSAAACGSGTVKPNQSPTPTPTSGRPSSTAVLKIVSPTPLEKVPTSGVLVKISLTGAHVVPSGSTNLKPDEGHIHLKVDGRVITLTGGLEVSTGPLTKGQHLIQVEFAASDHGPFNPRVTQSVAVDAE
jgi:hypothetical protein